MKTEMKMFASLPLYIVTTLFAFGCVSALPRVYKQYPRIIPGVPKQDPGILRRAEIKCEDPWVPFGSHCYASRANHGTWEEAQESCKEVKADLVTINSADENEHVLKMALMTESRKVWIGLRSAFYWVDSTVPVYTDWASGEPDGQAIKPCALMDGTDKPQGFWMADICSGESIGTVCKKEPLP